MKNFWTVGKWSVVILLGAGLLFAGCMGTSSSDDSAIPAKAGGMGAKYVYKFSVDPQAGKLDIEPVVTGTAGQVTAFGGLLDITSACAGYPLVCDITFKNLTAGQYMSRMRSWEYSCVDAGCTQSATATLDTSDYGGTLISAGTSGLCILEDGVYGGRGTANPSTPFKCPEQPVYLGGLHSTLQFLHPDCGSMTDTWTFAGDSNPYEFYTTLVDTLAASTDGTPFGMFPEAGNPGNDSRFDADRTTFVVKAYNLDNTWCPGTDCYAYYANFACMGTNNGVDGYRLGAPQCSTPIAAGQTLAPGQYFAVNFGFEWPDRIENQNHGLRSTENGCYEYPNLNSMIMTWDPSVLDAMTDSTLGKFTVDGTPVVPQAGSTAIEVSSTHGIVYGNKLSYADTNDGMTGGVIYNPGSNYLYIGTGPTDGAFAFRTGTFNALTCKVSIRENVGRGWKNTSPYVPDYTAPGGTGTMGAYGWPGLAELYVNGTRCDFQDLPQDADVDLWMALQYMRVKPSAPAGSGSIIKIEPNAANTGMQWFQSNCTRAGGMLGDDVVDWYYPCTGTLCTGTVSGTYGPTYAQSNPATITYAGWEVSNKSMPGGVNTEPDASGQGHGYQVNNAHVCVQ